MEKNQSLKIGLAFSGGGFRAAAFSLGVLTYLDRIKILDKSLLESVVAISTVSGGTIAGTRYAVGIKNGEGLHKIYQSLYSFMAKVDLVSLSLDRLVSNDCWSNNRVRSMINAFADIYDQHLFDHAKFGILCTEDNPIHLRHISFNSTEFATAHQFRFQWSEKILHPAENEPERGIIGNKYYQLPLSVASVIRMGDILAASSCFPGGFEPINFPDDFILSNSDELSALKQESSYPVGLMDGGIVDNQGIEPILLANTRMLRNHDTGLDLIIVSDVTSPYMEKYKVSIQKKSNWWRELSLKQIFLINFFLLLLSGFGLSWSIIHQDIFLAIFSTVVAVLSVLINLMGRFLKSVPKRFHVPDLFVKPLARLMKLKVLVYENLLFNRVNSLLKLAGDVFLKHVRKLNYSMIYENESWKNRSIMNAIYELRKDEEGYTKKLKEGKISAELAPSGKIQEAAGRAAGMGTTLWFTKDELEKENMLNTIIACGQFTMCWNLLEFIGKVKKDSTNASPVIPDLLACEQKILKDWESFQFDPHWMVDHYNVSLNLKKSG